MNWLDPATLLAHYGNAFMWVSAVLVFVECGLLFPFLPGDSLLFAVGLFAATGQLHVPLAVAIPVLFVAAIAGNAAGYAIGRAVGPTLYRRDRRFLKASHLDRSHAFFERHGSKALVLGRFVPIVRTFVTLVAGASRMNARTFLAWSAIGAALWVTSLSIAGSLLGTAFPGLRDRIDLVVIGIVALSLVPVAIEWWRHRHEVASPDKAPSNEAAARPEERR